MCHCRGVSKKNWTLGTLLPSCAWNVFIVWSLCMERFLLEPFPAAGEVEEIVVSMHNSLIMFGTWRRWKWKNHLHKSKRFLFFFCLQNNFISFLFPCLVSRCWAWVYSEGKGCRGLQWYISFHLVHLVLLWLIKACFNHYLSCFCINHHQHMSQQTTCKMLFLNPFALIGTNIIPL